MDRLPRSKEIGQFLERRIELLTLTFHKPRNSLLDAAFVAARLIAANRMRSSRTIVYLINRTVLKWPTICNLFFNSSSKAKSLLGGEGIVLEEVSVEVVRADLVICDIRSNQNPTQRHN